MRRGIFSAIVDPARQSVLIGVSLPDAVGQRQPQNVPGTTDEYPNWRIPLADGEGKPVFLEDLAAQPGVRAIAEAVRGHLNS